MSKNKIIGLAILSAAAIGLAACGNVNQTCVEGDIEVQKLVIGLECDYAPFNWTANASSEYTLPISNRAGHFADGYDIQIAKYLGTELNMDVEIVQYDWEALVPDCQAGNINLIIAGMTDTEERRQTISFTDEYYRSELVLVVKAEVANQYDAPLNLTQLAALLNGQGVVSQVSTVTNDCIETFVSDCGAVHQQPVDSFSVAALDVQTGVAFAMTAERPVAEAIVGSMEGLGIVRMDQAILGEAAAELGVSIGVSKANCNLEAAINVALAKLDSATRNSWMDAATERSSAE